jgi:hypothetical protein
VRAEEDGASLVAQRQDQRSDVTAPERVEARHRLVEEDDLRIVQQRLRDAHALDHPLRELAELQAALGAEPHAVEQRRDAVRRSAAGWPNSSPK